MEHTTSQQPDKKFHQTYIHKARPVTSEMTHSRSKPVRGMSARSDTTPFVSFRHGLEVKSNPIQLASRSHSARSSVSSLSSLPLHHRPSPSAKMKVSLQKDAQRPTSVMRHVRHSKKSKEGSTTFKSKNCTHQSVDLQRASKQTPDVYQKGFNIAGHLENSADLDRSSGSLSPDVDQFLKDIGAFVKPLTPEPLSQVSTLHPSHDDSKSNQPEKEAVKSKGVTSEKPKDYSRKPYRPKLAAKFGANQTHTCTNTIVPTLNLEPEPGPSSKPENTILLQPQILDSIPPTQIEHQPPDQNVAATKIQSWYRRNRSAQRVSVQSVLQAKKDELSRSRAQELLEDESREMEKQQRREAKMQAARKAAIEELNKKREQKRLRAEIIAQQEIALLQASGKIKKPTRKKPVQPKNQEIVAKMDKSPDAPDEIIKDFFQAGSSRLKSPAPPHSTNSSPVQVAESSPMQQAGSDHKQGNSYNDILKTLKLLEEVPAPLSSAKDQACSDRAYLSAKNLQKLTPLAVNAPLSNSASLSEGKLSNILAYLDEMEKADQDLLSQLAQSRAEVKTKAFTTAGGTSQTARRTLTAAGLETSSAKNPDASLEAATATASDVTTTILAQRIELDNKNKTIEMMQKALTQQRELTVYHTKEMDKDGHKKVELLRTEYESRIQRHQAFIDQLIDDKKVLSERCEQLVKQLRELDKKYKTNVKTLEEKKSSEISKLKQVTAAAEKLRREKWKSDETQRIKEATVKSLEPEIQRIIAKGKAEVQKLKAVHEADMLQVDERASRRFVVQMEELRAQCAEEKEQACAHERELARQRYEKMAEQEEVNYQQLRRKLFAEVQQEKNRLADQFHQQKVSIDQKIDNMQQANKSLLEELKFEHARQMAELERRHSCQSKDLTERSKVEKEAWEENMLKKQEAIILSKERDLRDQLRRERDKEIELVIIRLEEETTASREEMERAAEARVRRVREKYETELRDVERSERSTLDKFNSLKTQVVECEGELSRLQSLLRQKQEEVERVGEVASKLTREKDSVADIVRQEFADRLVRTEEENKDLKIERSELRARHKVDVEKISRDKDKEMQSVHDRVKQALSKKEGNLQSLREQYESALKRADHLEMLLEQQRKQLIKK